MSTPLERIVDRQNKRQKRRQRRKKCVVAVTAVATVTAALMGAARDNAGKEIIIKQINALSGFENTITVKTRQETAGALLDDCDIKLNEDDTMNISPSDLLSDSSSIVITRAGKVTISTVEGSETAAVTKSTVAEAVEEAGYMLNEGDKLIPSGDTQVTEGMLIRIIRVNTTNETVTETIEFDVKYVDDSSMQKGEEKVTSEGQNGEKELIYQIETKDGVESSRTLIEEKIIKEPQDKVIAVGTAVPTPEPQVKKADKSSSVSSKAVEDKSAGTINGMSYKKKITVTATAYTDSPSENGGHTTTAMGTPLRKGVIAVDPSVIPLGTSVYVAAPDGSWSYGKAVAQDTGGAIKGNKIDLCIPSASEMRAFGRKTAVVYILD